MTSTPVRPTRREDDSTPVQSNVLRLRKQNLKENITEILPRFKLNELTTDVILDLFALEPQEVFEKLNELKLPSGKVSIANLLSSRCRAFSVTELEDIYHSLQLYRAAFGSKKKKWMTIKLLEPAENISFPTDENVIRLNILQGLRIKGLNAVVKVITFEDLIWLMIIEKKLVRNRGIKLKTPIFISYEVGLPYIFTASKISGTVMECILRAMKYKKHKLKQLEGKDIKSLLALLRHKAMNVSYTAEDQARLGHRYIDLTHNNERESYVNRVFDTEDPVKLESFTVSAEAVWRCYIVPEMNGEPIKAMMTLKSKDLVGMVKHMSSINMVHTPLPEYLQTIVRSAKNKVCMKAT